MITIIYHLFQVGGTTIAHTHSLMVITTLADPTQPHLQGGWMESSTKIGWGTTTPSNSSLSHCIRDKLHNLYKSRQCN